MSRSSSLFLLAAWIIAALLAAATIGGALERYCDFRSGWSWDLAYYNQWFWALTQGDATITVRPIASYAVEGPPVWKINYLAPVRLLIAPLYALWPDPRLLLVVQGVVFWMVVPAAFSLVRAETRSEPLALSAAALVPLTPLAWPLAWNDFRELQLAVPFVLWAIQGWRGRDVGLTVLGCGGMLACRQEFAVVVASLAILPPREPESIGRTYTWSRNSALVGISWLLGFLGYLFGTAGRSSPRDFLNQFGGPRAGPAEALATAADFLAWGLGPWALLALLAPRVAVLALPWIHGLAGGRWALRLLAEESWHHVRYAAPMVALVLAAGLISYARLARRALRDRDGRWRVAGLWVAMALGLLIAKRDVNARLARAPRPVPAAEVAALWDWIGRVGPDDGVLTAYEVAAPLSSRRLLYSNRLEVQRPPGYPDRLGREIRWAFLRRGDLDPAILTTQGFEPVHEGPLMVIYRRDAPATTPPEGQP